MYFKASLVQFTTLCMCLWRLKLYFVYVHRTGSAASHRHCRQCTTCSHSGHSSVINDRSLGIHRRACAPLVPSCVGTLNPIASSEGAHFALATTTPAAELSHSQSPSLTRTELLIWITAHTPHVTILIYTNPGVKRSHATFYNFTTNFFFKSFSTVLDEISHGTWLGCYGSSKKKKSFLFLKKK